MPFAWISSRKVTRCCKERPNRSTDQAMIKSNRIDRDFDQIADSLKQYLLGTLESLESVGIDKLLEQRYQKLMAFGEYREG